MERARTRQPVVTHDHAGVERHVDGTFARGTLVLVRMSTAGGLALGLDGAVKRRLPWWFLG